MKANIRTILSPKQKTAAIKIMPFSGLSLFVKLEFNLLKGTINWFEHMGKKSKCQVRTILNSSEQLILHQVDQHKRRTEYADRKIKHESKYPYIRKATFTITRLLESPQSQLWTDQSH